MSDALPDLPPGTVVILATVGGSGPAAIPVSAVLRTGPRLLLLGLAARRGSLTRLREDPRVALSVAGAGFCVEVAGEAEVAADPLPGAEGMVAVRVRARTVRDVRGPATEVDAGIRWRWTDRAADERHRLVLAALVRLGAASIP